MDLSYIFLICLDTTILFHLIIIIVPLKYTSYFPFSQTFSHIMYPMLLYLPPLYNIYIFTLPYLPPIGFLSKIYIPYIFLKTNFSNYSTDYVPISLHSINYSYLFKLPFPIYTWIFISCYKCLKFYFLGIKSQLFKLKK